MSKKSRATFDVLVNSIPLATIRIKSNRSFEMLRKFESRDDGREFHELIKKFIKEGFEEIMNIEEGHIYCLSNKFVIKRVPN